MQRVIQFVDKTHQSRGLFKHKVRERGQAAAEKVDGVYELGGKGLRQNKYDTLLVKAHHASTLLSGFYNHRGTQVKPDDYQSPYSIYVYVMKWEVENRPQNPNNNLAVFGGYGLGKAISMAKRHQYVVKFTVDQHWKPPRNIASVFVNKYNNYELPIKFYRMHKLLPKYLKSCGWRGASDGAGDAAVVVAQTGIQIVGAVF